MSTKKVINGVLALLISMMLLITGVIDPITALASSGTIGGNLVLGKAGVDVTATAYDSANIPQNAVDGSMSTRWGIIGETGSLTVNLGNSTTCTNAIISDYNNTVTAFSIEYYNGAVWAFAYKGGTTIGLNRLVTFTAAISCKQIRLNITTQAGGGISEFELFNGTANKYTITVSNDIKGKSPKYVGFSTGGNLSDQTNAQGWVKYHQPNTIRTWYSPGSYINEDNITNDPQNITSVSNFDARKALFRADPEASTYYNWAKIDEIYEGNGRYIKSNLAANKKFGITTLVSMNYTNFSITGTWQEYWNSWRASYAEAYYFAKNYDIHVFQAMNEPDIAFAPDIFSIATYVKAIQVQSDAVRCAVSDVNRIHNKNLDVKYVAPVLASSSTGTLSVEVVKANRTDYHGNKINYNIFDWFDKHKYSSTSTSLATEIDTINTMLNSNAPTGSKDLPIVCSEWNWNTTGNWQKSNNNIYDSDSPNVFSTNGGTLASSMAKGIYAMYLFKHWFTFYGSSNRVMYAWGRDREDSKNIARGKPTTVSSFTAGYEASKAVDGDIRDESAWKTPSNSIGPQSIVVDLTGMYTIKYACIDLGKLGAAGNTEAPNDLTLQYWNGVDWVEIVLPAPAGGGTSARNFRAVSIEPPITTNKIRILTTDSGAFIVRDIFLSPDEYIQYVGGPMKSAEVNRLFATGFKNERNLYQTTTSNSSIFANTSYDPISNNYYMWISQPNNAVDLYEAIDLSGLDVCMNTQVTVREVSKQNFGDVPYILPIGENKTVKINVPKQSAILVTIPKGQKPLTTKDLTPVEDTMVSIGVNGNTNYSNNPTGVWTIRQSTFTPSNNSVTYMKFNTGTIQTSNIRRAVLELRGNTVSTDTTTPFNIYAFGIDNDNWSAASLTGNNAPNLNKNCAFLEQGGISAWPIGIMTFMGSADYSRVDITDYVKEHPNEVVSIALIKDRRTEQEINETDYVNISTSKDPDVSNRPKLKLWYYEPVLPYVLSNLTYTPNAGTGLIAVDFTNNTQDAKTANVVYAVYNGKKLVGIKISSQSIEANSIKALSFPTPIFPTTKWDTIKTFVFDTPLASANALCENATFVKSAT